MTCSFSGSSVWRNPGVIIAAHPTERNLRDEASLDNSHERLTKQRLDRILHLAEMMPQIGDPMKKQETRRLTLNRETVKHLADARLEKAAGGSITWSCYTCISWCEYCTN
jgi:hypothetical protein